MAKLKESAEIHDRAAVSPSSGNFPSTPNGVIGVVEGEVTPQDKAAAKDAFRALTEAAGRDVRGADASSASLKSWSPYSDEDSNIAIGAKRGQRLDDILASAVAAFGYRRVSPLVYRADWSTPDIEHILRFDTYGNPKTFLTADPGLRNAAAEAFAGECRRRYAHPIVRRPDTLGPWWCPVHFSLGVLCGWDPRGSLDVREQSTDALRGRLIDGLGAKLMPTVAPIKTRAALLHFLEKNDKANPPLLQMGGYYRAAQIAFLAAVLGVARAETEQALRRLATSIANGIDETRFTPESYIAQILADAEAAAGRPT